MFQKNILLFSMLLTISTTLFGATATWTGAVSSDFTDSSNWNPAIDLTDSEADNLTIGAGSPYDPVFNHDFDGSPNPRPNSFDTTASANFTMIGGTFFPYGNNTFNGNVVIKNGELNTRGYAYIGDSDQGTVTVDGGSFTSKNTMYIGRNSGNGTLNVIEGIVWFPSRPSLGTNGSIYIEEGGFCYISGNDVSWFQGLADSGDITTASGYAIVIDYQSALDRTRITAEEIVGATLPVPWDGTEDTNITTLSWRPGTKATQSTVYFGTNPASLSSIGSTSGSTMSVPYLLTDDTTYYWRVDTTNPWGSIVGETWSFTPVAALKPKQMEKLNRGVIAIRSGSSNFISWRLFGTDPADIGFNVYRGGTKINSSPVTDSTNYVDTAGATSDIYNVCPVIDSIEQSPSQTVSVQTNPYYNISVQQVPSDTDWSYEINDGAVGDLDGNGDYELIVKRYSSDYDEYPVIEAYRLDGTFLWRINLGPNHLAMPEINPIVYDLDGDGYAEVILRTCEGMIDGMGAITGDTNGDGITDYRSYGNESDGFIDAGPEFLTIFNGQTGAELARTDYIPRVCLDQWGDTYGHRANKFHIVIAYLDGHKPSLVMCRGIYALTKLEAWNYRNGELTKLWHFTSEEWPGFEGQGNHNLTVGDVDNDGKDEIVYGGMCVDHDGTGLYTTTHGHGDAIHMSDMDPDRSGLEVWRCVEGSDTGITLTDAEDGTVIFDYYSTADVGRACAGDIDPTYLGYEMWGSTGCPMYTCKGVNIGSSSLSMNFMTWWDGDLLRETLDHTGSTGNWRGKIGKWDYVNKVENTLLDATGTLSNNWTKGNPVLSGDIFGDWREEALWRSDDNQSVRIYTTTDVTTHRIYTLMHDPQYRLAIAWQCCQYNQPPHPGFYLGDGMSDPPTPYIELVNGPQNGLVREHWMDITGSTVSDLTGHTNYPDTPTGLEYISNFESPANWADTYGQRLRGYLCPEITGDYTFWIAGDDNCELWLSTDAVPENASRIAYVDSLSNYPAQYEWDKYTSQQSTSISLTAGHKYYIEALHKESSGDDHLSVGWRQDIISQPETVTIGSNADTWLRDGEGPFGSDTYMYTAGNYNFVSYLRFDLSAYDATSITNASLTLTKDSSAPRADTLTTGRFALHGLNNITGNTSQDWNESTLTSDLAGDEWDIDSVMVDSIADGRVVNLDGDDAGINITETISGGSTIMTVTGSDLDSFLQARANDGGLATFIITFGDYSSRGLGYSTKEHTTESVRPVLELTYTPSAGDPQIIQGTYLLPWMFRQMGDNTEDDKVNLEDFSVFSDYWQQNDCNVDLSIDLNGDCLVDIIDFSLIAQNWLVGF